MSGKNSARECLNEIRQNSSALLMQYKVMQNTLTSLEKQVGRGHEDQREEARNVRVELSNLHSRVSGVRDDVTKLSISLASQISFSKGARSVWKRLSKPITAGIGVGVGAVLVTFWEALWTFVKGVFK